MRQNKLACIAISLTIALMAITSFAASVGKPALQNRSRSEDSSSPLRIGEIERFSATLSFQEMREEGWNQTIHHPGASYIKVHFRKLQLPPGRYVTVSDPELNEVYTYYSNPKTSPHDGNSDYTVTGKKGFWAMSITGDTAVVSLHTDDTVDSQSYSNDQLNASGIAIDKYARGYPETASELGISPQSEAASELSISPQSVCGQDDRRNVVCFQSSRPTEFNRSRAVARLLINGSALCTGWRVSSSNRMLTNQHCMDSQSDVRGTEVWFNYQTTTCTGTQTAVITKVSGNTFLRADFTLDYCLFTVSNFSAISQFGFLELDPRSAVVGEEIYIPQHGGGRRKQLAIASDQASGGVCRVIDAFRNGRGTNTDIEYSCDTSGGSSGSPVLARSTHRVIALHHFGFGCSNGGVRIELINQQIRGFLP